MAKIDINRACETDMADDYLNKKIDSGGGSGGIGVSKQYVDDQDAIVQANVDAEAVTREEADTALQTQIDAINAGGGTGGVTQLYVDTQDAIVQANVDAEAVTRAEADTALQDQIDAIAPPDGTQYALKTELDTEYIQSDPFPLRMGADGQPLMNEEGEPLKLMLDAHLYYINEEIVSLKKKNALVQSNVDAEAVTRAEADTALQTNITAEETARTEADTALQTLITTETTDRTTADADLQSQIDALGTGGGSSSSGTGIKIIKLSEATSGNYVIKAEDYTKYDEFIIDEEGKSHSDATIPWRIVFPSEISIDSSLIVKKFRLRRLHGVGMKYVASGGGGVIDGLRLKTANSCRVIISCDRGSSTIEDIQDLVYGHEYIDLLVRYDVATPSPQLATAPYPKVLNELPLLEVKTATTSISTGLIDSETAQDAYNTLRLGVPYSECLKYDETTDPAKKVWVISPTFLVDLGNVSETNPFYRSLKVCETTTGWTPLCFSVVNSSADITPVILESMFLEVNSDPKLHNFMRNKTNSTIYALPVGEHFPRFAQLPVWKWLNYVADGDVANRGTRLLPDTTQDHLHQYTMPASTTFEPFQEGGGASLTELQGNTRLTAIDPTGGAVIIPPNESITGSNTGNRSYETSARWAGVQAWVYL